MIAYLIKTRVLSNGGIGQMQIASRSSVGYHPNTRIKMSHPSSVSRMGWNESQTTLFSPKVFQASMSGNSGVGIVIHTGKVGDDETISKAKSS